MPEKNSPHDMHLRVEALTRRFIDQSRAYRLEHGIDDRSFRLHALMLRSADLAERLFERLIAA